MVLRFRRVKRRASLDWLYSTGPIGKDGEIQMKTRFVRPSLSLLLALMISILPGSRLKQVSAASSGCVSGLHHGAIASQTWCKADNPHLVDNTVTVPAGETLAIEPGAVVEFYSGAGLAVAGSLVANGASAAGEQILFTSNLSSPAPGSWPGITAGSASTLQISYFEMAYAGQAGFDFGSLTLRTTHASLSHSRIHHGLGTALYLDTPGIAPQLNDVEIDHYTGAGLYQNTISMNPVYQDVRIHDTAVNGLFIPGGLTDRDVTLDGSPAAFNGAPIYSSYGITLGNGTTMTITPGTKLEMAEGISVVASAALLAQGTPAAPIRFTTYLDPPQAGSWQGIRALDGSTLHLSYCELAYAGKAGLDFGSLAVYTSAATVSHCRIHHGLGTALFLDNPGITPQFNDVEIDHYTGVGILQNKISMNPSYTDIHLHDNATDGVLIPGGSTDRNVTLDGSPAALNGAPIYLSYETTVGSATLTIVPGTTLKSNEGIAVAAGAALVAEGTPAAPIVFTAIADPPLAGSWGGITAAAASTLRLSYCEVAYAGRPGWALGALQIETSDARVDQCRIHDSLAHGIYFKAAAPSPIWNNVLVDNAGAALNVQNGSRLQALHTTLARNQVGLYVPSGAATLTNTIVADNTIGVQQADTGAITLTCTLFQANPSAIVGAVIDTSHINGVVAFEADGYHLSNASDAINAAISAGVDVDIDGDPRPIGSAPDLGADENRFGPYSVFVPIVKR
jgi:hypothetical protein